MANLCWFEIHVKGKKNDCYQVFNSNLPCYELFINKERGTDDKYFLSLRGECRWSLSTNMINGTESLKNQSKKLSLEIEAYAIDECGSLQEHYHYVNGKVLTDDYLPRIINQCDVEDGEYEMSEDELNKYNLIESDAIYVLKDEFVLDITFNEFFEPVFPFNKS